MKTDCPATLPFDGISEWVPIEFLPDGDFQCMVESRSGQVAIFNSHLLRTAMSAPGHLSFDAIAWRQVPEPSKGRFSMSWARELHKRGINRGESDT